MEPNPNRKIIIVGVGVLIALMLLIVMSPFTIIGPTERGVVVRNGAVNRVLEPGLHAKMPIFEKVVHMETSIQKEEVTASAASKDLQDSPAKVAINYAVDPSKARELYLEYQNEHKERLVAAAIQEAVKASASKYTAEELITKRPSVKKDIEDALTATLATHNISVKEVFITDFKFSESFNAAIEAKVKAEQDALAAKNKLAQVEYEAKQVEAAGEGKAKAIRLESDAANNPRYVELKRLEVQLELAKKWGGVLPTHIYGSAPIPFIDVR